MNESSGFRSDKSVKVVKQKSVKQLGTIPLNSLTEVQALLRPFFETLRMKFYHMIRPEYAKLCSFSLSLEYAVRIYKSSGFMSDISVKIID